MKDLECSNIVRLIDVLRTGNNYYIISELCNGGDLREYMKRKVLTTNYIIIVGRIKRINCNEYYSSDPSGNTIII